MTIAMIKYAVYMYDVCINDETQTSQEHEIQSNKLHPAVLSKSRTCPLSQGFNAPNYSVHCILRNLVVIVEEIGNVTLEPKRDVGSRAGRFKTVLEFRRMLKQTSCLLGSVDDLGADATLGSAMLWIANQYLAQVPHAQTRAVLTIPNEPSATPSSSL